MSYLLIQNPGELPIWGIRLLGRSVKSKPKAIGRFGTGLKESIALLGRLNAKLIVFSGTTRVEFGVHEPLGVPEICFRLSEPKGNLAANEWHGLGLDPDFGHHDWTEPWQALRELYCNALDESSEPSLVHHDIVPDSEVSGRAGSTRIFVEATWDILEQYGKIPSKILAFSKKEPELYFSGVRTYDSGDDPASIYHRGIWVQSHRKTYSLAHYDLDNLRLNESRSADWYHIYTSLAAAFARAPVEFCRRLITNATQPLWSDHFESLICVRSYLPLEPSVPSKPLPGQGPWLAAWKALYSPDTYAATSDIRSYNQTLKGRFIVFPGDFYGWLKHLGIPTVEDLLAKQDQEELRAQPLDKKIYNRLVKLFPASSRRFEYFVVPETSETLPFKVKGSIVYVKSDRDEDVLLARAAAGSQVGIYGEDSSEIITRLTRQVIALKEQLESQNA